MGAVNLDIGLVVIACIIPFVLIFFNVVVMAYYIDPEAASGHVIAKLAIVSVAHARVACHQSLSHARIPAAATRGPRREQTRTRNSLRIRVRAATSAAPAPLGDRGNYHRAAPRPPPLLNLVAHPLTHPFPPLSL